MAVFGTVIYFALEMAHSWLIQQVDPMGGRNVTVYDSAGSFITRTRSFVGHEAPELVYRVDTHEAAILGVRGETNGGFTTRQRLYFTNTTTCDPTDPDATVWIVDPTTAAGAALQYQEWNNGTDPTPDDVGYGHPVSDFYILQTIAFAMGPNGTLYRAHGSESTDPPLTPGFDPTIFGYPASEWASERYDAGRCRQIGPVTTDPGTSTAEQDALVPYLMQVDNTYTVNDKNGIPYAPFFWVPTQVNPTPPVPSANANNLITQAPATESGPPGGAPATFTDANGVVHILPEGEPTTPVPVPVP